MTDEVDLSGLPKILPRPASRTRSAELREKRDAIITAYKAMAQKSFMVFMRGLTIASQSGPRIFENCIAPFQKICFEDLAPNLEALRRGDMPDMQRFWIERTKKASKDADLAVIVMWLVAFPLRPFYGQIGAADRAQAGIVKERMSVLLHLNPWLNDYVYMVNNEVRSKKLMANGDPMCKFDIMSSDVAGSHGGTPDILIINELSHITKKEFAENLQSNAAGVNQGIEIIATNAGYKGTWQEVWRNTALKNMDDWSFHQLAKPAPWTNQKTLKNEFANLPLSKYRRLWEGVWPSGKGDALSEDLIELCFVLKGPLSGPEPGWTYFGAVDLGISHDHAGVVVLGVHEELRKIKLAHMEAWEPVEILGKFEVDLDSVRDTIKNLHLLFNCFCFGYDPHQAVLMAQQLKKILVPMVEMQFSSTNLSRMASCLKQTLEERTLQCYDEEGRLRRDFGKFNIVERSYGLRLEAVSDEFGHADVGTALVIALVYCVDFLAGNVDGLNPGDDLVDTNDTELTEEEVADMPSELRAIYGDVEPSSKSDLSVSSNKKTRKPIRDPFIDLE